MSTEDFYQKIIYQGKIKDFIYKTLTSSNANVKITGIVQTQIHIFLNFTILDVKKILLRKYNIPIIQQELVFGDQILEDHRTLLHYLIPSGAKLQLFKSEKKNDTTKAQLERTIDNFWLSQLERKYILRQTYNNEKLF